MRSKISRKASAVALSLMATIALCMSISVASAWADSSSVAVKVGDTTTVTSSLEYDSATQHIDYTISDPSVATVNKHKGVVTGVSAGSTTVTAHVVSKAYVSGGGTGSGDLCADEVVGKTQSWTISVVTAAGDYGLQGTGGLHIKMLDPMVTGVNGSNETGFTNELGLPMTVCSHGVVTFTYSQDGALNNGLDTYLTNSAGDIYVTAAGSSEKLATLAKTGSLTASVNASAGTVTLMLDTASLKGASSGVLYLGKGIKNNSGEKTVGIDLAFPFSVGEKTDMSVTDAAVAATCTAAGKTEGSHCGTCGKVIVAQSDTPKADHVIIVDAAVAATTSQFGKTEGSHCANCGEVFVAQTDVKKLQSISAKAVVLTAKKGRSASKKISVSAKGTLSYKKTSGASGISIVKASGGFTVKASKSMKPGTYTIKVKISAAGTSDYQPATPKTVAVKVKVTK